MKALVIGGSGFVGSAIVKKIAADEVSYFSRNESKELKELGFRWIKGNILNAQETADAVSGHDMIIHAAGIFDEREQRFQDINLQGIKNIVAPIKTADRGQRLVYISCINVDFAPMEFFHSRRLTEGNVSTVKNSLIVRTSVIFGNGDRITPIVTKLAKSEITKLPETGNMAAVNVEDLVEVIGKTPEFKGSMFVCSRDRISLKTAVNLVRKRIGKPELGYIKPKPSKIDKTYEKLQDRGILEKETLSIYSLNYYRENTSLYRFVEKPRSYGEYLEGIDL